MAGFPSRRSIVGALAAAGTGAILAPALLRTRRERLTFWHIFTQSVRSDDVRRVADEFEALHPGVAIEIETMPPPAIASRLPTAIQANTLPDLMISSPGTAVQLDQSGLLHPVDDAIRLIGGVERFHAGILERASLYRGRHLALPAYLNTKMMIYRHDRLARAGIAPPANWQEMAHGVAALTRQPAEYGWLMPLSRADTGATNLLWLFARALGGHFFDRHGSVTFSASPVREAAAFLADIIRLSGGPVSFGYYVNDSTNLATAGKTSIVIDSAAVVAAVAHNAPEIASRLAVSAIPGPPGGKAVSMLQAPSFMIPKGRNNQPALAAAFLAHFYDDRRYLPFLETIPLSMFPSTRSAQQGWIHQDPLANRYPAVVRQTLADLPTADLLMMEDGLNPFGALIEGSHIVEQSFERMVIGREPVADVLEQAAIQMDLLIATAKRRAGS